MKTFLLFLVLEVWTLYLPRYELIPLLLPNFLPYKRIHTINERACIQTQSPTFSYITKNIILVISMKIWTLLSNLELGGTPSTSTGTRPPKCFTNMQLNYTKCLSLMCLLIWGLTIKNFLNWTEIWYPCQSPNQLLLENTLRKLLSFFISLYFHALPSGKVSYSIFISQICRVGKDCDWKGDRMSKNNLPYLH